MRRDLGILAQRAGVCPSCRAAGCIVAVVPCLACRASYVAPFSSNDLRRTCATWLVKRDVPFNLAAKVLGHASTFILTKVYGQLDAEDVGRLINARIGSAAE